MTCIGCDSTGYRKLCFYDDEHNTCNNPPEPPLQSKSYKCVGTGYGGNNKRCVQVNDPPGPGRYPSMQQCQADCSTPKPPVPPLQSKSYKCVGTGYGGNNKRCDQMNAPPGPGRYPSMQQCQSHCGGGDNVGSSYTSSDGYIDIATFDDFEGIY